MKRTACRGAVVTIRRDGAVNHSPKSTDKAYRKWSIFVGVSAKGAK